MSGPDPLSALLIGAVLIVVHVAGYLVSVRYLPFLSTERAVIRYHVAFVLAMALTAGVFLASRPDAATLTWTVALVAMTGFYSLSFAIFWSLSEGSYSLAMIARVRDAGAAHWLGDLSDLEMIGAAKQETRIANMARLRLLTIDGDRLRLAPRGRWIVRLMRVMRALTNTQQGN
jgi:hypothetical protein